MQMGTQMFIGKRINMHLIVTTDAEAQLRKIYEAEGITGNPLIRLTVFGEGDNMTYEFYSIEDSEVTLEDLVIKTEKGLHIIIEKDKSDLFNGIKFGYDGKKNVFFFKPLAAA